MFGIGAIIHTHLEIYWSYVCGILLLREVPKKLNSSNRRYGLLRRRSLSSCKGLWPSAKSFLALQSTKNLVMQCSAFLGIFLYLVVTIVTLSNLERDGRTDGPTEGGRRTEILRASAYGPVSTAAQPRGHGPRQQSLCPLIPSCRPADQSAQHRGFKLQIHQIEPF